MACWSRIWRVQGLVLAPTPSGSRELRWLLDEEAALPGEAGAYDREAIGYAKSER